MNVTSSPIPAVGAAAAPRAEGKSPALLITAALSIVLFLGLALALANHVVFPFDQPILAWARTFDGSAWIWNDLSQSANFPLIAIGVGFVLWLIWSQRYREALVVIVMLVAVTAGSEGVKELTARPRPSGNGDGIPGVVYSFPSGHILECSVDPGRDRHPGLADVGPPSPALATCRSGPHRGRPRWRGQDGPQRALPDRPFGWPVGRDRGLDPVRLVHSTRRLGRRPETDEERPQESCSPRGARVTGPAEGQLGEHGPLGPSQPAPEPAAPPAPPELGLAAMTVVVGFVGLVASLLVLGFVAEGVRDQEVFALDTWATPFLHGISSPGLDAFMNGLTDIGSIYVVPILFVAVVGVLIWRRRYRAAAFIAVASLGSLVLQGAMKPFFARPRPQLPWAQVLPDYSFPSGHTMNTVIFYGAVALRDLVDRGSPGGAHRRRRGRDPGARRGREPDLPRLSLPDRRRWRHPGRDRLADRRRCRIPRASHLAAVALRGEAPRSGRRPAQHAGVAMTRALVIGRRRKGRQIGTIVRDVRTSLRAEGWQVESALVTRKRTLESRSRKAIQDGCDVVVAVGGDGAVVRVASAVATTKASLGIIPTGTGNLLASNLGIPHHVRQATRVIVRGRVRRIDLGRVVTDDGTKRDFAVACGVGFDAEVIDATGPSQKLRWGKLAYIANALGQTGTIRNVAHTITLDGTTSRFDAAQVFVANFGKMLPLIEPRQPIVPDDGLLDVLVVRAAGPLPGLLASWEALRQKGMGESDGGHVFRARAKEIRIETEPTRLVESDGNSLGKTPVTISVRPRALRVLAPARKGRH